MTQASYIFSCLQLTHLLFVPNPNPNRLSCGIEAAKNCGSEAILTALREEAKADVGSEVKVLGICDDDDDDDDECEVVGLFQFGADGSRLGTSSPEVLYAKQGAS